MKLHFEHDARDGLHGCRIKNVAGVASDELRYTKNVDRVTCNACRRAILSCLTARSATLNREAERVANLLFRLSTVYGGVERAPAAMSDEEENFLRKEGVIK